MKRILLPSSKDDTISLPPYVDFRAEDNRVAPWDVSWAGVIDVDAGTVTFKNCGQIVEGLPDHE